jgi:hypothetical protein
MSAAFAFSSCVKICDYIIEENINHLHPLAYPLVLAMVVTYARPFKQRRPVKLPKEVVPRKLEGTHNFILLLRDKMFAHADTDGPGADEGLQTNRVLMTMKGGDITWASSFLWLKDTQMQEVRELSQILSTKCDYHARKIWNRYSRKMQVGDGKYEINIGDDTDELLVHPHEMES